jgi:hypothetical protein
VLKILSLTSLLLATAAQAEPIRYVCTGGFVDRDGSRSPATRHVVVDIEQRIVSVDVPNMRIPITPPPPHHLNSPGVVWFELKRPGFQIGGNVGVAGNPYCCGIDYWVVTGTPAVFSAEEWLKLTTSFVGDCKPAQR